MQEWLDNITHNPAFLAVSSILTAIIGALILFSKTSFGKKALQKMVDLCKAIQNEFKSTKETVDGAVDLMQNTKKEMEDLKEQVFEEVKVYFDYISCFEKGFHDVVSQIPNAKVQAALLEFESTWKEKKKKIEEHIGASYDQFDEKLKEIEEEKNKEISDLKHEIEELKQLFKNSIKVVESGENEQRNETINEETTKE